VLAADAEAPRALCASGADPNVRDRDGKTVHDLAVEKNDAAVLEILSDVTSR